MSRDHERLIRQLATTWGRPATDDMVAAYLIALGDLPADEVAAAIRALARSGAQYMPPAPWVRRAVLRLRQGEGSDPAGAWGEVKRAIGHVGRYGTPQLSPLAARTVEYLGGWLAICDSDNEVSTRARFLDTAARLVERAEREQLIADGLRHVAIDLGARPTLELPGDGGEA